MLKDFIYEKDGYVFEYNFNFGHINVDNLVTGDCEDCIEVGFDFSNADRQSFISKCDEWVRKNIKNNSYSIDYINTIDFNDEDLFYPPVCECGFTMVSVPLNSNIDVDSYFEVFTCPRCKDKFKSVYL